MTHFVYTVKWHIGNVFNKPPRQNAPTDRVLTSVILKGIEWAFRKVYPTKIPGMVHQGLLAPQSLYEVLKSKTQCYMIIVSMLTVGYLPFYFFKGLFKQKVAWRLSWSYGSDTMNKLLFLRPVDLQSGYVLIKKHLNLSKSSNR